MKGFLKVSAIALASLGLALAAPRTSEAAPGGSGAGQVSGPLQNAIIRNRDVDVSEQGRFIEPCIDILRGLRLASAVTGAVNAEIDLTYVSDGQTVTDHRTIPLSQFYLHPHATNSNPLVYEQVAAEIDVGDAHVDNDEDVTTTVSVVLSKNGKRQVLGASTVTTRVVEGGAVRGGESQLPQ
ncbi:MAG: hypothetical protein U0414_04555 [Polyangiaceae bacterium]